MAAHRKRETRSMTGPVPVLLSILLFGCARLSVPSPTVDEAVGPVWFEDVTGQVGLDFIHNPGPIDKRYFFPQIVGSGAALFDFDNDGRLDLYLIQNAGPHSGVTNRLYRQGPDGRFVDVSRGSGLDVAGYGMGVAVGDVNNDGWPDVLLTEYGGVRLFLNNGNGTFTDVTREAGLDNPLWATAAAFVDYDRDGWLDLVIVNYVDYIASAQCTQTASGRPDYCPPARFGGSIAKLYHNEGRGKSAMPQFRDVSLKSGLGRLNGAGLGVVCADFDGDGWPDIFVANDGRPNHLWMNQHDGTFKEEAIVRGLAYNNAGQTQANMGIALGDVWGDGRFAVFVTHLGDETHGLWLQQRRGFFQDRAAAFGLASTGWRGTGFGTLLADFDQDGALDLAIVNGRVARGAGASNPALSAHWNQYAERSQLFRGDGTSRFTDVSLQNTPFCGTAQVSRGLACGDLDGDGALDLVVTTIGGPARVFRNVAPQRGHWLLVRAFDPKLKRDALGATVTVEAAGRRWVRWIAPSQSYLCSSDPRAHFGLGSADRVEQIRVLWPDGTEEHYDGCPADRVITIRKGEGRRKVE
jgi:hypothetical protein